MSFRAFGRLLLETAARLGLANARWKPWFLRSTLKAVIKPNAVKQSRNLFVRLFQRTVRAPQLFRPFSTTLHFRPRHLDSTIHGVRSRRWIRASRKSTFAFLDHVKSIFSTNQRYNAALATDNFPQGLDNYEIGKFIAVGCNAAVYELRNQNDQSDFPLALKIMFNYDFALPERIILRDMMAELVPLSNMPSSLRYGQMGKFKPLKQSHPNVIKLHTAFVDNFPDAERIERAQLFFPEALPSADMFGSIINEPKTLFIVMKRYRMTLRDYVLTHKRNYWAGRVMLGQLLEALVFLYENNVSHRDLKSDNILLEFDSETEIPSVAIADFGSALTSSFQLFYDEFADLGGNLALRAPEIRRAQPGTMLNFHLNDTWAAGTLAYEIFTRMNPFYSKLSSATYTEDELPSLPQRVPTPVKSIVYRILKIDPAERVLPHVAANAMSLSLFRFGNELSSILRNCGVALELYTSNLKFAGTRILDQVGAHLEKKMDEVIGLFAAETISANLIAPNIISRSELQLRATFLARVEHEHLRSALEFFADTTVHDNNSTISSASNGYSVYCNWIRPFLD